MGPEPPGPGRGCGEGQALAAGVKGTDDVLGNLDLSLRASALDEDRVQPGKHFAQGQWNHRGITIRFRAKERRGSLSQFAEGDFHNAAGELAQDFLERNANGQRAGILLSEPGLQFERQVGQDGLEREFDPPAVLMGASSGRRGCSRAWRHHNPALGRRSRNPEPEPG